MTALLQFNCSLFFYEQLITVLLVLLLGNQKLNSNHPIMAILWHYFSQLLLSEVVLTNITPFLIFLIKHICFSQNSLKHSQTGVMEVTIVKLLLDTVNLAFANFPLQTR